MAGDTNHSHGTQPSNERGHPMPRRATPEKSVTLQHHRLAREASRRATPATETSTQQKQSASSPKRGSSGESHETNSGAEKWFDRSNRNPAGNYDGVDMDIDPPFFQKETESSNEGAREPGALLQSANYSYGQGGLQAPPLRPTETHSSSADDFRSVIDDLTIENKRLKEELRRYKQFGPPMMRKEKLFEIKVHGLPKRKKRELEATLRDFAASLEGSSESHSQRRRQDRQGKNLYSSGESRSKHASSSSSHSRRPVDSAYASMSTGPSSHAPNSVVAKSRNGRPLVPTRAQSSADQKTENYPVDTPDGLFPRHVMMTDKDRKKLVVRRLEQLFTGKISGRNMHRNQSMSSLGAPGAVGSSIMGPPQQFEPSREAVIQPLDSGQRKPRSRDNSSTENGDQTESGGNGNGSGRRSGHKTSPPSAPLPEQRPTRPRDLDPDRLQIPSENLDYIRHLGLVPTEFLMDKRSSGVNVSPDADGWVYLNLLCNLAQLHIFNVTPGFIRTAVSEKSTKFQLSPDGQKIRWRGGTDGTKFSSDSSGDNSQKSPSADDTDGSNHRGQRKRVKTNSQSGGAMESKFIPQGSSYSESFHYKPLFVHRTSSAETSLEGTGSQASDEVLDDSNPGNSKWGYSGSGSSQQRRRRIDGAIIYYSGAPFCTDLSGDPGDTSPTTYMTSTARDLSSLDPVPRLEIQRSLSGSSLVIRPLSEAPHAASKALGMYSDIPIDVSSDSDAASEDEDVQFPWSNERERVGQHRTTATLESCGLGGVVPEDHFAVMVTTRRPITHAKNRLARGTRVMSEDNAEAIANRLAYMRTASPLASRSTTGAEGPVKIQYLADKLRRFKPWPLPPPAMFIPPFSTDDSESISSLEEAYSEDADNLEDYSASESLMSRRANPHLSVNTAPEHADLPFDDDDGDMDVDMAIDRMSDGDDDMDLSRHPAVPGKLTQTGSSVATAGGAESGYSSSLEDDAL